MIPRIEDWTFTVIIRNIHASGEKDQNEKIFQNLKYHGLRQKSFMSVMFDIY